MKKRKNMKIGNSLKITQELLTEYREYKEKRYKISSVNSMLAAINSFFVYIGREELKVKLFKVQRVLYSSQEREMMGRD